MKTPTEEEIGKILYRELHKKDTDKKDIWIYTVSSLVAVLLCAVILLLNNPEITASFFK